MKKPPIPKLTVTSSQFDGLHEALDKVRESSTTVKVDKEALRRILADHSDMVAALGIET